MREIELRGGGVTVVDDEGWARICAAGLYEFRLQWPERARKPTYCRVICRQGRGRQGRKILLLHRFLMNAQAGQIVDHCDRDPLNNRMENLRFATPAQSGQNATRRRGMTGYRGVFVRINEGGHPYGLPFGACITADGKHFRLGNFARLLDAAIAYDNAARTLHGEFAVLNFP